MSVALKAQSVSIAFGGVAALEDVSIDFPEREIIGIIGPNGAGKTTLLNVICGMTPPDEGEVFLHDVSLTGMKPSDVASLGLRRTFQSSQLFPGMSVLENMMCGLHLMGSTKLFGAIFRSQAMKDEEAEMRRRAMEALNFVGFKHFADRPGSALSFGQQRIIEIARKYNLRIIEDCAESLGVKYKNKPVGSLGNIAAFSFYSNKTITSGEGGMITTNSRKLFVKAKSLKKRLKSYLKFPMRN